MGPRRASSLLAVLTLLASFYCCCLTQAFLLPTSSSSSSSSSTHALTGKRRAGTPASVEEAGKHFGRGRAAGTFWRNPV
jgi:hypothetical protein